MSALVMMVEEWPGAAVEEADDGAECLVGGGFVDLAGFARVEGIRLRAAELPSVIEGRLVIVTRGAHIDVGKTEFAAQLRVLLAGVHHAHMRNERARLIEAGQLYAVTIVLEPLKQCTGDALGG